MKLIRESPPIEERIRVEIKQVVYHRDKPGHKVLKSKSITVYESSLDEVMSVIKAALEAKEKESTNGQQGV